MGRGIILGIVVVVVLTVFAIVDCAMTDARRAKVLQKPIWLVVILLLPVIGPLLWIFLGKSSSNSTERLVPPEHPDNVSDRASSHDARIRELEEEMRKLDEEIEQARRTSMNQHPSNPQGSTATVAEPGDDPATTEAELGDASETPGGDELPGGEPRE